MLLPDCGDGFFWAARPWGVVLAATNLAGVADHFFTTRQLRLRGSSDARREWALVASGIGVSVDRLLRPKQVHGRTVVTLPRGSGAGAFFEGSRPEADALVTDDPSVALAVQVADCVPLLAADRRTGVVAAVHAGWRGTAAGVAVAAIGAMTEDFGVDPADIVVAIGPSIGPCCYEVGPELVTAVRNAGWGEDAINRWFRPAGRADRLLCDLRGANRDQLIAAGVRPSSIAVADLCTVDRQDLLHSYRAEGAGTGRIAAVIRARR